MRTSLAFSLFISLGAAACPPASATQKIELPSPKEDWIRVETEHFVLFGNTSETTLVEVGQEMERFGAALAMLLPAAEGVSQLPTHVYVFKDHRWFGRYVPSPDSRHRTAGLFVRSNHGNNVAIDADPSLNAIATMFHEYTHFHMTSIALLDVPVWFSEGIAEYFSTFQSEGDVAEIGRGVTNHIHWLREHQFIALDRLFAVNHESPEYNEGERRGTFYSQAWVLVHYLMCRSDGRERLARLQQFLETLRGGGSSDSALELAFGFDQATALDQLAAHVDKIEANEYTYMRVTFRELKVNETVTVLPLPHVEVLYWLGRFLAHQGTEYFPGAEAHFQAALAQQPSHGPSLAGLGLLLQERDQHDEAATLFDQAVRTDSTGALTHLLAAENLFEIAKERHGNLAAKGSVPEEIRKAQVLLLRALELDPNLNRARTQLAYTYLIGEQDPSPGIAALEHSEATLHTDESSAYNLLLLHLRRKDRAAAREVFDRHLRGTRNLEIRDLAREALLRSEMLVVDSLMSAKEYDAALAHVQRVATETQDPEFMKYLEKQAENMSEFRTQQLEIDRYNQAVELANANKFAEAEKILVGLVAEIGTPDLKTSATTLLEDVRRARAAIPAKQSPPKRPGQ